MNSLNVLVLIEQALVLPLYAVWIAGIVLAVVRWRRHPQVSALLLAGFFGLLVVNVVQRFGFYWIVQVRNSSMQSVAVSVAILSIVSMLLRAVAWTTILIALFGWRQAPEPAPQRTPFQFSILGLMGLTLLVAVLCGVVRWLIALLGDSAVFLLQWIDDIPLYACWVTGLAVAISRWNRHPRVSQLAVAGIGLTFANAVLWQAVWTWQVWSQYSNPLILMRTASVVSYVFSVVGAALVLCAVAGWRDDFGERPPENRRASPLPV